MTRKNKYLFFLLAILFCFTAILFIRPDNKFLFGNATGDCSGRSTFMYNALYKTNKNPDVALFGSSRTMNGINDSLMNALGEERYLNLGYCRFGRNLDYFFIEEYCKHHQPKIIVLEVRETEGSGTHPVTPFFMPVTKIADDIKTFNPEFFKDVYDKWLCNLKFLRGKLFDHELTVDTTLKISHGFWYGNTPEIVAELNAERSKDSISRFKDKEHYKSLNRNSKFYFDKLKALTDQKHITLRFLYLPSYGNLNKKPVQEKDYLRYGAVLIPPDSIVCDPRNFSNFSHLNKRGADRISIWLKDQFD